MSELITEVELLDLISQLGKEIVVEYFAEDKTVEAIVDDLLAMQGLTPAITKGTISNSIKDLTRSIQIDGDSILRALYRLRDTVGGYIDVDNDRQLNWLDSIGEDKGQQIRYRKNLKGIERDMDFSQLANRIYAYGEGEGDARITLPAPGYIEDTDKQTEWGGVYSRTVVDRSITHPDTLLAWAQLKLAEHKDPPISYRIDTVDLSQSEEIDFSFEALQLGSKVKIIDTELGVDVKTQVVRIEHPDLLHPQEMTIELSTLTKDITDTLSEVYDLQQLGQHVATKIGAGQVIVLGEFSVIDWVSEGTTYIKGGYIRTGLLESTNWGVGAGSQFNLDDGTFKLGGSDDPKLSWNGTALVIKGTIYATAGEFAGTLKSTSLEAGETFSAADETVIIDDNGIKLKGEKFLVYYGSTLVGKLRTSGSQYFELWANNILNINATTVQVSAPMETRDIDPNADNARDLGNGDARWKSVHAVTVYEGDAVFANDWRLTETPDNKGMMLLRPDGSIAQEWR